LPAAVAPLAGTANVFGPGMTWLSGNKFNLGMEGNTIYVNDAPFVVLTVTDSEHLILTTSVGLVTGASWRTPAA
jgi:hypothetical protein